MHPPQGERRGDGSRAGRRRRRKPTTGHQAAAALGMALLSAILPGVGHIRAGRKKLGIPIFAVFVLLVAGGVYVATTMDRFALIGYIVDPDVLTGVIVCALLLSVAWTAVIVSAYRMRRPSNMRPLQLAASAFVVALLSLAVSTPPIYAAHYAYVGRDVINTVFPGKDQNHQVKRKTKEGADPWAGRPRINVLLLGGDWGNDRTGVRTDSMTVASINTHTGDTVMYSLPRNMLHAPMPKRLQDKFPYGFTDLLNAVYRYGADHPRQFPGHRNHGAAAIREVAGKIVGLPIDYSVLVNLRAFREIIDAMGGITIYVNKDLPIGGKGGVPITGYVHKGLHHLNGEKALWYARSRAADDDYHRMRRQRCVLGALAKQADPSTVLNGFQKIASTTKQNVSTNIPNADLPALLQLGEKAKSAEITSVQFVPPRVDTSDPDYAKIRKRAHKAIEASKARTEAERTAKPDPGTGSKADGGHSKSKSLDDVCRYR
ncbi:MAG: LCP family protein [Streptosporangiales bacterium]